MSDWVKESYRAGVRGQKDLPPRKEVQLEPEISVDCLDCLDAVSAFIDFVKKNHHIINRDAHEEFNV